MHGELPVLLLDFPRLVPFDRLRIYGSSLLGDSLLLLYDLSVELELEAHKLRHLGSSLFQLHLQLHCFRGDVLEVFFGLLDLLLNLG